MADSTLTTFASVAGVAGIGLGIVLTIFKQAIQGSVLKQLPEEKAYQLLRLVIVLTFLTGMFGMVAWLINANMGKEPKNKESSSLSIVEHDRAVNLANKGCFFYTLNSTDHAYIDSSVELAQQSYISRLRSSGKGFKFLFYGEPDALLRGGDVVTRQFGTVFKLAQALDIPDNGPIDESEFVSMNGWVGGYRCKVRVVSTDYKEE
ncbi:hypothetical protein [Pseudomonas sp. Irchel s3h14]|uniref:hypothetical protein n=1 Tax=Pseudomonas sp. Irchel s3h14 TaxID=2009179 RepID=UPI0011408BE0|nr:hypothetical protein [Pseudomonas sp. Irchel s3h14]